MADYFTEKLEESKARIPTMEHMLGKGLLQPCNNTNTGARKIMHSVHRDHVFPLINGEKAILETGYEIRFGDYSSSVTSTDSDYKVVNKISKFSFSPNHHYWIIVEDTRAKRLDIIERISYQHISESYGFLFNNTYIDSVQIGSMIPKDTIVQKSLAFDEYNNRKDGCNFNVCYMALDQNMEDSVIISDVAASKLTSPLIKKVSITINENNIPLNIYGTENTYKCIPDIGEKIKDSILITLRKEKKEEMIYAESVERLRTPMMSDEKKILSGTVIDVDIRCNNPNNLDAYHNSQFKLYYNELMRMSQEIVSAVTPYVMNNYEISYDLKKLYANSKRILNHDMFIDKKPFSNIILEVTVLEELPLQEGDKTSNRFGGKGIVSKITQQKLMPRFDNDQYVDVILNSSTMYGRENPGQIFELHITHVGGQIIRYIEEANCSVEEAFKLILEYINIIVPEQAEELSNTIKEFNHEELRFFLESFITDKAIDISSRPISDSFDIDRLCKLYESFPWIKDSEVTVPMINSNGEYRFLKARRNIIVGKEYMFRLKQFAEEKFSATSLSSTNIRGENTKSKASKNYNDMYSNTPIRFGNMEINNLNHLGAEAVVENLLIHSLSPHARRLVEQMYTENPYSINIRLDDESTNRAAEIVNTYLKTIGRRLVFKKVRKKVTKFAFSPVYFNKAQITSPIFFNNDPNFDPEENYKIRQELASKKAGDKNLKNPLRFYGVDLRRHRQRLVENEKAKEYHNTPMRDRKEETD